MHPVRPRRGRAIVLVPVVVAVAVAVVATVGIGSESAAREVHLVVEPNIPGNQIDGCDGAGCDSEAPTSTGFHDRSATTTTPSASAPVTSRGGTSFDPATGALLQQRTPCCSEGRTNVFVNARSAFDQWSSGGHWDFFNANYDLMLVYEPYWDSRLRHYDDVNVYAI